MGLIPIKLHLRKLGERLQLQAYSLSSNYLIWFLIDSPHSGSMSQYPNLLDSLTSHQQFLIKSHIVDIDNRFNGIFPSFSPLHSELFPSHRVIDNFSDCFVFNLHSKQKDNKTCTYQLDNMVIESSSSLSTAIVVTDASIKNKVTTSI